MIQIVRLTYNDDKDASVVLDIKICSSIDNAKKSILFNLCVDFDGEWNSLESAAKELCDDLSECSWDEDSKVFHWMDNGKGERYIICEIEKGSLEWQHIGEIA